MTRKFDPIVIPAPGYGAMIEELRAFLDNVGQAAPDAATVDQLKDALRDWNERLALFGVPEAAQPFGKQYELPGRGQTLVPSLLVDEQDMQSVSAQFSFGRFFLGANGAAHGGAITLLFDDIMGRLANTGRPVARTASLQTDFRRITPIETPLSIQAWVVREEGRKRFLRAKIMHGEAICAEAEGLFVRLLPGQP